MFEQLEKLEKRYQELEHLLASYGSVSDKEQYNRYARELSGLRGCVSLFREHKRIAGEIEDLKKTLVEKHEREFLALARTELEDLENKKTDLEKKLKDILAGEDKDAGRDVIVEIRQGTGGMEAGLFAADLYRMYAKYAANKGWSVRSMALHQTELGGFKEIVFSVKGKDAYRRLRFESGVHRVQRVPTTESQGRIHTSTAT